MKKKLLVNSILIIFILIAFDLSMFYIDTKRYYKFSNIRNFLSYYIKYYQRPFNEKYLYNKYILGFDKELQYRRIVNYQSNEKPILLFGGSYVYGHKIKEDAIASEKFGKYTNNPIYNRSYHGMGPQLMLYHLETPNFYEHISEPKLIIYTFHREDLKRIIQPSVCSIRNYIELFYTNDKNSNYIVRKKTRRIPFTFCNLIATINKDKTDMELFKKHILESKKHIDSHWKNTKFILFIYQEQDFYTLKAIEKELKENGIIIIKRRDIATFNDYDRRFAISKTDAHPNEYAWDYIVPKLIKEIEKQTSK